MPNKSALQRNSGRCPLTIADNSQTQDRLAFDK
jgi:hypothetical protein